MKFSEAIVLFTPGFPADENDTACLPFLQDIVLAFNKMYPQVKLVIIPFQYPFTDKEYDWKGNSIFPIGGKNRKGLQRILTWKRVWKQFLKVKEEYKINGIISFWLTECAFIGQKLSSKYNIPVVAYLLGQDAYKQNKYLKIINFNKLKVAAISENSSVIFQKSTGRNVTKVVITGLDKEMFAGGLTAKRDIDIMGAGSHIPLKNYSVFIEIVAWLIKNHFPDIKVVLTSTGPETKMLNELVDKYEIRHNFTFTGNIDYKEVIALMQRTKIFLHTSHREGYGAVIMEALYYGAVVVCMDIGRQPIEEKVFVCKDKEDIMKTICNLLSQNLNYASLLVKDVKDTVVELMEMLNEE